jgi:hypothetical protein
MSAAYDVTQITVVLTTHSATLFQWSDTASRVPGTLPVVKVVTPFSVLTVVDQIYHGYCAQHHLELLDMQVDFFIILW